MLTKESIILALIEILGVGLQMTESKLIGLLLIFISSLLLWWILSPQLKEKSEAAKQWPRLFLWGGWGVILLFCGLYGWWISGDTPVATFPPQVSSTNQSGGVTGNDNTVTNNYYAEKKPHPYSLNDEQIALLAQRMAPFARSFDKTDFIFCIIGSPDSNQLATDLVKAFRTAGWIIPSRDGFSSNLFQQTPKGIFIQVPPGNKYPPGYREFILTLKEFGIVPPGKVQGASNSALPPDQFQIIVGTRP